MNTRLLRTYRVVLLAFVCLWSLSTSAQQVSIGATSGTTSYFYGPYYRSSATSSFNYSNYGYLYTATELGIPAGSTITQIEWLKASGTLTGNNTFNIWLENTSNATMPASITWGNLIASATQVYSSTTQSFSAGPNSYESFTLTTPFIYSGGNLIISTEHIKSGTASAVNNFYVNTATNMAVGIANSAATTTTTSLTTTGGYGNNRPTIRITYVPGVACSGAPSVGTLTAPPAACPGMPFTISHIGYTAASGLTFLWEESPAGANTWSPVAGGTNPSLSLAGITTPTDYRVTVTCTNGGAFDVSTTVSVGVNPVTQCYCTPIYTTGCTSGDNIDDVILLGDVAPGINNLNTPCPPGGYADFTAMSATVNAGFTYSGNVTTSYTSANEDVNIFIDYNANGIFEATESVATLENISNTSSGAFSFTVPAATPAGSYRMRVRLVYGTTATSIDPCNSVTYGEAHDYTINVVIPAACSGTPATPVASGPSSVCLNQAISLSATGYSVGTGLTFQWESFDVNTNAWVPVPGATLPNFVISGGQTTATDYRFVTTCSNGGGQSFSNTVSIGMSSFNACYCSPLNGTTLHSTALNYITKVEILGTTLNNPSTTVGPGGYTQYIPTTATTTTNLDQGLQYTINVTHPYTGYFGGAWIDWDQSGTMDPGEFISMTTSGLVSSGTFIVPYTSIAGLTGLRVRMNYNAITSGQPCNNIGYETEDYLVNIIQAFPCTGIPNVVSATGPSAVCAGVDFTLTASNYSTGLGISYEWQYFDINTSTWLPVSASANTPIYTFTGGITTATDYRFVTTCSNGGGQDQSNTISISINPPNQCYCTPIYTTGCGSGDNIDDVILAGDVAPGINNLNTPCPAGGYQDYTTMSASLSAGMTYSGNVTTSYTSASENVNMWIDFNANGVFESTESVATLNNINNLSSGAFSLTIPATTPIGTYRMRIRLVWGSSVVPSTIDPCTSYGYGETHDYTINVTAPPACMAPGNLAAAVTGSTANVSWDPVTNATGYEWAIDQSSTPAPDASTTVNTSITTTPAAVTGLSASSTYYLHVRSDCGSVNGYSAWAVYSFSTPPPNDECVNAINISNSQLFNGVTTGAIQSMAACDATANANDVWYSITTGSVAGSVTVNVNTTVGDIVMEAFSGTCGSFTGLVPTASSNSATTSCVDQVALGLDWATYTLAANTTYYVRVYGYNGANSTFTIEALGTPLAVKLSDISATNVGKRNRVDWITASETAGDRFELERSADGRNFTQLSTINARGEASTYSYWDEKPVAGVNYYRLRMMDAAGNFTYSDVVTAKVSGTGAFTVEAYPNPVSEMLTVKVYGTVGNNPTVSVSDVTGKVVKVVSVTNNEATINMSGLAQGMYLVKYTDNNNTETIKVNKK